ncbi:hypothetical protein NGM10_07925 [Halorussus salilacus]|uniref:hypothetical protein n=1 Tax=Halorussus salilacus TaxID=2953750 RepID=UPI0020A0452E|nr:hypothetical protein [Halorussus salilacus]USZ66673.1 hypothetical protein NGM10_07925 [Halorussus salilacus]
MGVCYVLSDAFYEKLVKRIDPREASELVDGLEARKRNADEAEEILESKTLRGTKHVRQMKIGQWRIASLYVRGIEIAEVVQLCYLYNKNKNTEPDRSVLQEIDAAAERLFAEAPDWPPDEESEYLEAMQTQLPEV